jgi:multidrug efflux pump
VLTGYLYYIIPKGIFPLQDTGMLFGIAEAAPTRSASASSPPCTPSSISIM